MKKITLMFVGLFLLVSSGVAQKKYAILFGGEDNGDPNNPMFAFKSGQDFNQQEAVWNDTYLMWELLINNGFDNDDIIVLYHTGVDLPRINPTIPSRYDPLVTHAKIIPCPSGMLTDKPATKKYLIETLKDIKNGKNKKAKLLPTDTLHLWFYGKNKEYKKIFDSIFPANNNIKFIKI